MWVEGCAGDVVAAAEMLDGVSAYSVGSSWCILTISDWG